MIHAAILVSRRVEPDEAHRPVLLGVMEAMSLSEAFRGFEVYFMIGGLDDTVEHHLSVLGPDGTPVYKASKLSNAGGYIQAAFSTAFTEVEPGRSELKLLIDGEQVAGCFVTVLSNEHFESILTRAG